MQITEYCYQCLENLAKRTAELATPDSEIRKKALNNALDFLKTNFSAGKIPTWIAGEMQRVIRNTTENKDPYKTVKKKEMKMAALLLREIRPLFDNDLKSLLALAALGNSIDFFVEPESIKNEVKTPVFFSHDDILAFENFLSNFKKDKEIFYFADNAGECYFDLPLIEKLEQYAKVTYIVKENPVQNDLTLDDLKISGIRNEFKNVIITGTDTPGLDLSLAPATFQKKLLSSNLIIAKGMGYYETLPGLSLPIATLHLLKAKCQPIAASLNVPLNSFVALFKETHM